MTSTPWHFWPIVFVALVWHLIGVIDYSATTLELDPWMQMMSQRQTAYVDTMPSWVIGAWAVGVWAGLLGVLMMTFRAGLAAFVLALSAIGLILVFLWAAILSVPDAGTGAPGAALWILAGSAVLGVLLWLYARAQHKRGIV